MTPGCYEQTTELILTEYLHHTRCTDLSSVFLTIIDTLTEKTVAERVSRVLFIPTFPFVYTLFDGRFNVGDIPGIEHAEMFCYRTDVQPRHPGIACERAALI